MENLPIEPVPQNALGDFYVVRDLCMRCCLPHKEAPELMNDSRKEFRECYFRRQTLSAEETDQAIQAIWVSELEALRYGGTDQAIISRLHDLGCGRCCDEPLVEP